MKSIYTTIDTPALLIDQTIMDRNIAFMIKNFQSYAELNHNKK